VKGFEAKVQVYGVELAKYVLITSWCYVLYLLWEVRIESNPASQVYARSFLRIISSFGLLCRPVIFYCVMQRNICVYGISWKTSASLP